ncbi:stalk domain-containing protein [Desulfofundulus thermosubterraneus]|uniref:stalk domain-containing protein n=1 Tax=Desulfofundulus thermosubterraneus TaxID=348840 RepID=UPI001041D38F|nr:stalk domain-containing protein [Desulfofundulus thermosubterraneus]
MGAVRAVNWAVTGLRGRSERGEKILPVSGGSPFIARGCSLVLLLLLLGAAIFLVPRGAGATGVSLLWNGQPWLAGKKIFLEKGRVLIGAGDLARAMGGVAVSNPPYTEIRMPEGSAVRSLKFGTASPVAVVEKTYGAQEYPLDTLPHFWEGELYVPLRFVVTAAGGSVQWYEQLRAVSVRSGSLSRVQLACGEAELGGMFFRRGLYKECLAHYRQAVAWGLETAEIYYHCLEAYRLLGDREMAARSGENALRIHPVFADRVAWERDFPLLLEAYLESSGHGQTLRPELFRLVAQRDLFLPLRVLLRLDELGYTPEVMKEAVARYEEREPGSYLVGLYREKMGRRQ